MARRRRNSDDYVRDLERRVSAGDLTLVGALANAYERVGRGQPAVDPEIIRALYGASGILEEQVRSSPDDDHFWGVGGAGNQAMMLVDVAISHLQGTNKDEAGNMTSIVDDIVEATRDAVECEECGARFLSDDREEPLCDDCVDDGDSEEDQDDDVGEGDD